MLELKDFSSYKDEERILCWKHYTEKNGCEYEADFSICFNPKKDDAWYQIIVGACTDDNFEEIMHIDFYKIKDAIKWWNENIPEEGEIRWEI